MSDHVLKKIIDHNDEVYNIYDANAVHTGDVVSTYSASGTNPVNGTAIAAALDTLDVSSVGGDGKYISAISEENGKISATATSMDTAPTANSTKAVTSGGIKTALDAKADSAITSEVTIANGDKIIIADASDSSKIKRASVAFDGSTTGQFLNKKGTFTKILEADLDWGGSFRTTLSPTEASIFPQNLLANPLPEAIKFEKSDDGGLTWTEVTLTDDQKRGVCNLTGGTGLQVGNTTRDPEIVPLQRGRLTIGALPLSATAYDGTWCYGNVQRMLVLRSGSGTGPHCVVETQTGPNFIAHNDVWTNRGDYAIVGDSGWNSIPFSDVLGGYAWQLPSRTCAIRLTFWNDSASSGTANSRITIHAVGLIPAIVWTSRANLVAKNGFPVTVNNDGTGTVDKADKLSNARKLAVSLSNTSTDTTFNGSADVTNIKVSGTLGVANGGTGKTSAADACNSFLNALSTGSSIPVDADYYISQYVGGGTTTTTYHRRPVSALWNYIKGKLTSVSGVDISGNAATASAAQTGSQLATDISGKEPLLTQARGVEKYHHTNDGAITGLYCSTATGGTDQYGIAFNANGSLMWDSSYIVYKINPNLATSYGQAHKFEGLAAYALNSVSASDYNVGGGIESALNGKQATLATQTAYQNMGSATTVPQITTNSLGQVTGITEVTITGVAPASHTHGSITNDGKIGSTADLAVVTGTSGAVTTADLTTASPSTSGISLAFVDTVSQDSKGKITATKKNVTIVDSYSSTGTDPVSGKAVAEALGTLDVSSVGGSGKYISAISESDGKISATATTMDTSPTASSTNAVTSGGVKTALDTKLNWMDGTFKRSANNGNGWAKIASFSKTWTSNNLSGIWDVIYLSTDRAYRSTLELTIRFDSTDGAKAKRYNHIVITDQSSLYKFAVYINGTNGQATTVELWAYLSNAYHGVGIREIGGSYYQPDDKALWTYYNTSGGGGDKPTADTANNKQVVDFATTVLSTTAHTHGNITSGGALQTTDITIASGDKLVVTDASNSNKVARASVSFDGTTVSKALTQKGTFESVMLASDAMALSAGSGIDITYGTNTASIAANIGAIPTSTIEALD